MKVVVEYSLQGHPRKEECMELFSQLISDVAPIVKLWMLRPVLVLSVLLPSAIIIFTWFAIGFLTKIRHFWKTTLLCSKIKSIVPSIIHFVQGRISWEGYRNNILSKDVKIYSARNFFNGEDWLPHTGFPYDLDFDS